MLKTLLDGSDVYMFVYHRTFLPLVAKNGCKVEGVTLGIDLLLVLEIRGACLICCVNCDCDVTTVDREIFAIKIFLSARGTTKIKRAKN